MYFLIAADSLIFVLDFWYDIASRPMTMQQLSARVPRNRSFEHGVPPVLRPILRAYVLGYASSTFPRIMTLALLYIGRKGKNLAGKSEDRVLISLAKILKGGLEPQRFPTFCKCQVLGELLHLLCCLETFCTGAIQSQDVHLSKVQKSSKLTCSF